MEINSDGSITCATQCVLPKYLLCSPNEGAKRDRDVVMVLGILDLVAYILRYAKGNLLAGFKGLPESAEELYNYLA